MSDEKKPQGTSQLAGTDPILDRPLPLCDRAHSLPKQRVKRKIRGYKICEYVRCQRKFAVFAQRGRRPKFCSDRCRVRNNQSKPEVAAKIKKRKHDNREAKIGRQCYWCAYCDVDVSWSVFDNQCAACEVQRRRSPCTECEGPFYTRVSKRGQVGCVLKNTSPDKHVKVVSGVDPGLFEDFVTYEPIFVKKVSPDSTPQA